MRLKGLIGTVVVFCCGELLADMRVISAQQYEENWPFTLEELELHCLPGRVLVVKDPETGAVYALNGEANAQATALDFQPLATIWRADPELPYAKIPLQTVLHKASFLCIE